MASDSEEELLNVLHAHGQQFLNSFSIPVRGKGNRELPQVTISEDEDETWDSDDVYSEVNDDELDSYHSSNDGYDESANDLVQHASSRTPSVFVFSDSGTKSEVPYTSKASHMKSFMSSKVSKLREDPTEIPEVKDDDEMDESHERSNAQNDADLHRLVHTKLLSGSLNPEICKTSGARRKALAGRLLELAGGAKLGEGEKLVRASERNKASLRIRTGILEKQKERSHQQLQEAKNLGNYHPSIKKNFEFSKSGSTARRRGRGLKIGVGKFSGGMLKLSKKDIDMAQDRRQFHKKASRGSRRRKK